MKKTINYQEGTCFLVPLRTGGFARGVVARLDGKGTFFGYFFAPNVEVKRGISDELHPAGACLLGRCGDLGLLKGSWPILGTLPMWQRESWPVPPLYRQDEQARKSWLSFYDDRTLKFIREESTDFDQGAEHPYDRLMGYGAAEIRLTKLVSHNPDSPSP